MPQSPSTRRSTAAVGAEEPESMAELRADCARMAPRWLPPTPRVVAPVSPPSLHGFTVPPGQAELVERMPGYGDA